MVRSRTLVGIAAALVVVLTSVGSAQAPASFEFERQEAHVAQLILVERRGSVMGTSMLLEVLGTDRAALEAALIAAEAELRRVEDLMTDWRDSPLMRLNAAAGQGAIEVEPELARMVHRGTLLGQLSGGAFDPTWRALGGLWDFKATSPQLPQGDALASALKLVDFRQVHVDTQANTVSMPAGFQLGLGGIAKGYGVDRAMEILREHGVQHALVDAGGDLKALGLKFGQPWKIAIKHPRDRQRIMAVIPVANQCVVTSGDYERFFEIEGKRYHHILDPRTGLPSTGCMSATVVGPSAATCDALATALCVLKPKAGLALLGGSGGYEALVVGLDGAVHTSPGLTHALTEPANAGD